MIKVTDLAREKASQLMKEEGFNPETDYIRVGVKVEVVLD
jgi:iron-sulfur cluster assembly protein